MPGLADESDEILSTRSNNNVHRMANLFSSMQQLRNNNSTNNHHRNNYNDDSSNKNNNRLRQGDESLTAATPSRTVGCPRSRSTETNTRRSPCFPCSPSSPSSTSSSSYSSPSTAVVGGLYCCDLKVLDNKSKFSSAKALFESLERQSREQKRTTSSSKQHQFVKLSSPSPTTSSSSSAAASSSSALVAIAQDDNMSNEKRKIATTCADALGATTATTSCAASAVAVDILGATTATTLMTSNSGNNCCPFVANTATTSRNCASTSYVKPYQPRPRLTADRGNTADVVTNFYSPPPPVPPKPPKMDPLAPRTAIISPTTNNDRPVVVGSAGTNSLSKFLNSYSGCLSPSASSASSTLSNNANIRKYPKLTQTLSMENNAAKLFSSSSSSVSNDGSVVTLIGSPKMPNVKKFAADNPPSDQNEAYEPYWRSSSWHCRRYNVAADNNPSLANSAISASAETAESASTTTSTTRNYSLRQNETRTTTTTEDSSSSCSSSIVDDNNRPNKLSGDFLAVKSSSTDNKRAEKINDRTITTTTTTTTSALVLNLCQEDNNSKLSSNDVQPTTLVDYMTREEASVLLSPATREEVLMHASLASAEPRATRPSPSSSLLAAAAEEDLQCNNKKSSATSEDLQCNNRKSSADVKTLPNCRPVPQDAVDLSKRLSVCSSVDNNDSNDRYSMNDSNDVHWLADGHFWMEIAGLIDEINNAEANSLKYKKPTKVTFSHRPIRVYSTYSGVDYDRRNDEVDPVSASAEYELERRLDKMDVFDVDVDKGNDGLGFSIIGMGVGADAGLEKLGIFVKSITPGGAVFRDGRIRVCDQIVEVDGKSLVGVSQSYAASVLRATSGTVKFKIGREKDLETSEIAQLIRQSLEQDRLALTREKEIFSRRAMPESHEMLENSSLPPPPPRPAGWGPPVARDSPLPSTDSVFTHEDETPEQLVDNPHIELLMTQLRKPDDEENDNLRPITTSRSTILSQSFCRASFVKSTNSAFQTDSSLSSSSTVNEATLASLNTDINRLLNESLLSDDKETHFPSNGADPLPNLPTSARRESSSANSVENEFINRRIGSLEFTLVEIKQEAEKYQNLLMESQEQFVDLEKKYAKAKKLIRDYQEREKDLLEREESHLRHLKEKDQHYSDLLKQLNDKVGELEKQLTDAQRKRASLAERTSGGGSNPAATSVLDTDISPALAYLPSKKLEIEQFQTNSHKTTIQIVPNSPPPTEENAIFDFGIPETPLLDNSFAKSKAEAVRQSVIMSARQLPSRHVDDEFFEHCQRKVKLKDATVLSPTTPTVPPTSPTPNNKLSPTKNFSAASTSVGSPLTPRRLTQVLWMRKKTNAPSANKELELSVMRGHGDFDKIPEVFQWNCDDVCKFLKTLGLEKYSPEFSINRVDGCKLMQLDGAKLKSMGIQNHTDRALIKKRVKDMKSQIDKERKLLGKEYKKFLKAEKEKKKT